MFDFTFEEWYWLCSVALIMGTIWHLRSLQLQKAQKVIAERKAHLARTKEKEANLARLRNEVVRTRYMLDAWLIRHGEATLRHPGAKVHLIIHMNALRAYHEADGGATYSNPGETVRQYDNPYWRAVWHIYHHGNVRCLPPCPFES